MNRFDRWCEDRVADGSFGVVLALVTFAVTMMTVVFLATLSWLGVI